jgi:hypothetical protein
MGHLEPGEAGEIVARHGHVVRVFVETGTHVGVTFFPVVDSGLFETLHSVELSLALYRRASEKLSGKGGVLLHHGDSAVVIRRLAREIEEPAFFWLDAHWFEMASNADTYAEAASSAPAPLLAELEAISSRPYADIVAVDDVHCFGKKMAEGPGGDWTAIHEDSILDALGRKEGRVALHYHGSYGKFVVHRV